MDLEGIREEMNWSLLADGQHKDVLVVAHNQPDYLKNCIDSVLRNTENFHLRIWDNASDKDAADFIRSIESENITVYRGERNIGFIVPNNRMARDVRSEWIILLNSDTEVKRNWDNVLIGTLMANPHLAQTGFKGGMVDERMVGVSESSGTEVDYICGYCLCIGRDTYEILGLFDEENLEFAYCEDADLSFRIRESGRGLRACYSEDLVHHFGSRTISEVLKRDKSPILHAEKNRRYMEKRWASFASGGKRLQSVSEHKPEVKNG